MKSVETIISQHMNRPDVFFVFPTEIAASAWAEKALDMTESRCAALERFTAWDHFKSTSVRSEQQNRNSIPSVMRRIFARRLIDMNAQEAKLGKALFTSLIPAQYADSVQSFDVWIEKLLPQLLSWTLKRSEADIHSADDEDKDLETMFRLYTAFLDAHNLFEPAWERPPFRDDGNTYYVFFPEILQDFAEYKELLESAPNVRLVSISKPERKPLSFVFENTRREIRETALYIRSLAEEKNIPWTDIAVSAADLETLEPYILREFSLYNIPYRLRAGKKLSSYPAGRLFSDIQAAGQSGFTFESVKQLLMNKHLPWKNNAAESSTQLIEFGIDNNCLCPYENGGKTIDVWMEAFSRSAGEERARSFYETMKDAVTSLCTSPTFADIKKRYHGIYGKNFRDIFFDNDNCPPESDLILSRCLSELALLIDLEKTYPDEMPSNRFEFFCSCIDDRDYLAQQNVYGVNIFPYRAAAPAPFACHILIGASQDDVSVTYSPLSFLPHEKRTFFKLQDINVSDEFIHLYQNMSSAPSGTRFSSSSKTFSGYHIPHSAFDTAVIRQQDALLAGASDTPPTDLYSAERTFFDTGLKNPPDVLHSLQKKSFNRWLNIPSSYSGTDTSPLIKKLIETKIKNYVCRKDSPHKIRISATALNSFFACPRQWLYERILSVKSGRQHAQLVDEVYTGTLYHAILERFFKYTEGKILALNSTGTALPAEYDEKLKQFTQEVIDSFPASCGIKTPVSPLTTEILASRKEPVYKKMTECLTSFLYYFADCKVAASEKEYTYEPPEKNYVLEGKIDLILQHPEGGVIIIDFKSGKIPPADECIATPDSPLSQYQLPMYIRLYELNNTAGKPAVQTAAFFGIMSGKLQPIVGTVTSKTTDRAVPTYKKFRLARDTIHPDSGIDFELTIASFEKAAEYFAHAVETANLTLESGVSYNTCSSCDFLSICRTNYNVSGDKTPTSALY